MKCEKVGAAGSDGDEGLGDERGNGSTGRSDESRHIIASRNKTTTTSTTTTTNNLTNTRNMSRSSPHGAVSIVETQGSFVGAVDVGTVDGAYRFVC